MANDNLVVIAAMARKGGSGKTTLSRALISAAVAAGRRVLLIDTDSTGVLGAWHQWAEATGFSSPLLRSASADSVAGVDRMIEQVYAAGSADFIFIDTAGVGAEWSDGIAVLADHIVTPVMLSTSDIDVGAQTADWFEKLKSRVDDPASLPRHHVVLNMVDPKTTRADAALIEAAVARFPVVETVMMRRNAYKEMDQKGLLHAASLRQDVRVIPERGKVDSLAPNALPSVAVATEEVIQVSLAAPVEAPDAHGQTTQVSPAPAEPPTGPRTSRPTRKIDILVNALARQEAALFACGVDPAHVIRAALRRAVNGWHLSPDYVSPSQDLRTRHKAWRVRTSLAVDTTHLQVLLRDHDPLDVLSKWALIRGQVEPRVWAEIDTLLNEIAAIAALRQELESPEDIDTAG